MLDTAKRHGAIRRLGIFVTVLLVVALVTGCSKGLASQGDNEGISATSSASSYNPVNGIVQSNNKGAVTIDVKWIGLNNGQLIFDVAMNTHSVDLSPYGLVKLAMLRDDEGTEYVPTLWDAAAGGHHRSGTLIFSPPISLEQKRIRYLELVIRGVAGVDERVFRWEFQQ